MISVLGPIRAVSGRGRSILLPWQGIVMSMRRWVETVCRHGACVPEPDAELSDYWFREEPRGRRALELQRGYAREACAGCPVRIECLLIALSHEQASGLSWGIWGGVCASDRASALQRAREVRPEADVEEIAGQLLSERPCDAPDTVDDSLLAS